MLLLRQERPLLKQMSGEEKRSKDEWAVKKAMMHAQAESEKETEEKDDNDNASQVS
jgi:hypothetical protein